MGNYDSVPLKPEEVQNLRQTFTAESLETMLEQASSLYGEKPEVGDPDQKVLEEVEAIKVKHEREIFDLKTEIKKKVELQRETERTLNEVKWELEEHLELNRQNEAEIHRLKEDSANEGANVSFQSQHLRIEESSKKTKEILKLKKERAELLTKFNNLDKLMNEHEKMKEEETKKLKEHCDFKLFQNELKFTFLQRKYDELNEKNAKAQASLDLVELRSNMDEINRDLLRKEVEELKVKEIESLKENTSLRKQVEDLKAENKKNCESALPLFRFRDVKTGN